jgi:nucleoid DNA-binding protein
MNKLQMIDLVAEKLNLSKKEATTAVETIFGIIKDCLLRPSFRPSKALKDLVRETIK